MNYSFNPCRTALGGLLSCIALATLPTLHTLHTLHTLPTLPTLPASTADEVQFPAISSSYLKTGDFIDPGHVRRVNPGLNKDQVRLELGNPHFSEGIFGVREWDYVFNFYRGKGNNDYLTCQFKVIFNNDYKVASTHWKGPNCLSYINPADASPQALVVAVPLAVVQPAPPARRRIVLSADGLFAFGKSGIDDLGAPGIEKA